MNEKKSGQVDKEIRQHSKVVRIGVTGSVPQCTSALHAIRRPHGFDQSFAMRASWAEAGFRKLTCHGFLKDELALLVLLTRFVSLVCAIDSSLYQRTCERRGGKGSGAAGVPYFQPRISPHFAHMTSRTVWSPVVIGRSSGTPVSTLTLTRDISHGEPSSDAAGKSSKKEMQRDRKFEVGRLGDSHVFEQVSSAMLAVKVLPKRGETERGARADSMPREGQREREYGPLTRSARS